MKLRKVFLIFLCVLVSLVLSACETALGDLNIGIVTKPVMDSHADENHMKARIGDMRNFYQTDEGEEYYKEWIKRNRELVDEYGSSDEITYASDDEDDDE